MKNIALGLLIGLAVSPLWAQSEATSGATNFEAERARLAQERKDVDARYATEQAACYKKFAVEDCLQESRRRRRTDTDNIKRQEAVMNDFERKRRAAAQLDKLEQKKADQRAQESEAKRQEALKSQQDRDQRAADHAASRAQTASQAAERQKQFDDKQRAHAEEQAKAAQRRAEAPAARSDYEEKQKKAQEHRADLDRRNAAKTKPRSAPLPTPGEPAATSATPSKPASP